MLEYESTLELLNREGTKTKFNKHEQVRYLQANAIAYQVQAWNEGEHFVNYRCTRTTADRYNQPGKYAFSITLPIPK